MCPKRGEGDFVAIRDQRPWKAVVLHHIYHKHSSGVNSSSFGPGGYKVNHFCRAVSEDQHLIIRSTLINHGGDVHDAVNMDGLPLSGMDGQML